MQITESSENITKKMPSLIALLLEHRLMCWSIALGRLNWLSMGKRLTKPHFDNKIKIREKSGRGKTIGHGPLAPMVMYSACPQV